MNLKKRNRVFAGILLIIVYAMSFQWNTLSVEAASSVKIVKSETYHLYHNKWTADGGTRTVNDDVKAKLHYIDGVYGYCVYMQDSSAEGAVKEIDPSSDNRTDWLEVKKNGYQRSAYCAVADAYLVHKSLSLDGISDSTSLMNLTKTERMFLAQAFVWYMQFAGWNRTEGSWAMAIKGISGWGASKQYRLFDQLFEAIKNKLSSVTITTKCYKNKVEGNSHQPITIFTCTVNKPSYAAVSKSAQKTDSQKVSFRVTKTDLETDAGLAGAVFTFYCDGEKTGTATSGEDGKTSYIYNRTIKTQQYTVTKNYVSNWNELSSDIREQETQKGYYSNAVIAGSVAQNEADQKADAELASLLSQNHTWKVTETTPPFGHSTAPMETQIAQETLSEKSFSFEYVNPAEYREIQIKKLSSHKQMGMEATLDGAVYGLYAREKILGTDNKTIVYEPDSFVAELKTDEEGKAVICGVHPGEYYLQELTAPKGFEIDKTKYFVDVSYSDAELTVTDQLIRGRIKVTKTYGQGNPEREAGFEIFNSKEEFVASVTTNDKGEALTDYLPYGTYIIRQNKGLEGYELMPDQTVFIDEAKIYQLQENDQELYAGIAITKTTYANDRETGYYEKRPEEGAEFRITRNESLVETIVTNSNGFARSGKLEPGYSYHVEQIKGSGNFEKIKPFDINFSPGEYHIKRFSFEDRYNGKKVKVKKTMTQNGKTIPEEGAYFFVLDAKVAQNIKEADLSTEEKRMEYCNLLPEGGIVTTMFTNRYGEDVALLTNLPEDHDFIVLQVRGEKGYKLAEPYFSNEHHPQEEGVVKLYTFCADDTLEDWSKIRISKTMVTGRNASSVTKKPEANAEFQILDSSGKVADTVCTDSSGEAVTRQLKFGTYIVHQTKGAVTHEKIKDFRIILNDDSKQKTVSYELQNEEKPVIFELTKQSGQSEILLNGATYEIFNEGKNRIATITTGLTENGKAVCELPYGEYTVKECKAPDGYKLSEPVSFKLSFGNTEYKNGQAVYEKKDFNDPVHAKIVLKKTGDVLTGFSKGQFDYEEDVIAGAEYTLYARKNITKDDGTILYPAGTAIDTQKTDGKGKIEFSRVGADDKVTSLFPMGEYYVKETKGLYGYALDTKEYDVILGWDRKAEILNTDPNIKVEEIEEKEEPVKPETSTGKYILKSVASDMDYDWKNVSDDIVFTNDIAPSDVIKTDVSSKGDGSVVMWMMGQSAYISTQTEGQDVILNANSEGLFKNAEAKNIYFDCVDTSHTEAMTSMFENCDNLTMLDISNFNTEKVRFMDRMFYSCDNLSTVYAPGNELQEIPPETLIIQSIIAEPKYEFLIDTEYRMGDFNFYVTYNDGSREKIELTDQDVRIEPEKAQKIGKEIVTFHFLSGSRYAEYDSIQTETTVVGFTEIDEEPVKDYEKKLILTNQIKNHRIQFYKMDENGTPIEGAEFTLYAACDIVNSKGEILFQAGDAVSTAVSEFDGENARVDFRGLPSDLYKKNAQEQDIMFAVKETKAAPGYKKADVTMKFDMGLEQYGNAVSIVHTSQEEEEERDSFVVKDKIAMVYDAQNVINENLPYVTLQKTWNDYNNSSGARPKEVEVEVTLKDGVVLQYTIRESDGWICVTDIPKGEISSILSLAEKEMDDYHVEIERHSREGVIEIINTPKELKKNLAVKKIWKDGNDQDGLRPESIIVDLYRNGTIFQSYELNEKNDWYIQAQNLEVLDEENNPYDYEFKEQFFSGLNENVSVGYKGDLQILKPTGGNKLPCETTVITNQHMPETLDFTVKKVWKDEEDLDGIRPEEIEVVLYAGSNVVETVKLSEENSWTTTVTGLPAYENGKKIVYKWEEKKESWLTGNKLSGYTESYDNQTADADNPCVIINEHETKRGTVTIRKAIHSEEIVWDKMTPKFVFELSGITVKGESFRESVLVEFTEAEVTELKKSQGTTVWKEIHFDDLLCGTYTITETGTEGFYELTSIDSDSTGIVLRDENGNVKKDTTKKSIATKSTEKPEKTMTVQIGNSTDDVVKTWDTEAIFTNTVRKGTLQICKKGKDEKALRGVEFTLYDSAGQKLQTKVTDEKGECLFTDLPVNDYVIRETKTVEGYSLLKDAVNTPIPLILTEDEVKEQNADTSQAVKQGNKYYYYNISYDIDNSVSLDLPATGGTVKYWYLILGIFFMGSTACFQRRGKSQKGIGYDR